MKILVDADACPVKNEILRVAREFGIQVIMFIDTSHILNNEYGEVITVDKGKDSVDIALINKVDANDIVVTQDYGVATMALGKKAKALNQNGVIFTDNNIDQFLFERELSRKLRRSGRIIGKTKKRQKSDDDKFEIALRKIIGE